MSVSSGVCEHGSAQLSLEGWSRIEETCEDEAIEWLRRKGVDLNDCFEVAHTPHARYAQIHFHRRNEEGHKYVNVCGCIGQSFVNVDVIEDPPPWLDEPIKPGEACGWVNKPAGIPGDPRQDRPDTTR